MAQNEDALWEILNLMYENMSGWTSDIGGRKKRTDIENGFGVSPLKGRLVLNFLPQDIEDTLYFMKHRDYLMTHGQGMIMPEAVYSLTDKGISVYRSKSLPEEEKEAFKEALWNLEPKLYGIGPNLKGWMKKWNQWRG